ncbi:MAG: chromosomal replication initiator protein DnaA [Firmicutes bacterium]|nr:chromosomal replication initiator protein DnaA [Bacillota bacterium]
MKIEEVWNEFMNKLEKELAPTTFRTWFKDIKLINEYNNKLTIQVPMEIHKSILRETYGNLIEDTLFSITNENFEFNYITEAENLDTLTEINAELNENDTSFETNLNKDLNFDNFVVGSSNRLAYVSAMTVAQNPGKIHNPLFIYGKSGIGKTHLMHAIGNYIHQNTNKKVLYTTSDAYMTDFTGIADIKNLDNQIEYANNFKNKYRNVDVLIIDDIQFLANAEKTQQEFFNTFNDLQQSNKQLIISSDKSPNDLKKIEERLRSRFTWGLPVDIYPPDFELRVEIIKQKIKNTSLAGLMDNNVIEYIANSCTNDVRHLEGTINRLMAYTAMVVPEKIDVEFANAALNDYLNKNIYSENNIESIQKAVSDYYNITVEDLKGKKKSAKFTFPRQVAMYLSRMLTDESFPRIGLEFGGRDHSTVIHSINKIDSELNTNLDLKNDIENIKNNL